jgi:hypothetical protein
VPACQEQLLANLLDKNIKEKKISYYLSVSCQREEFPAWEERMQAGNADPF